MKYTGSLAKDERASIFELFLYRDSLKFSDIEKSLRLRSNMIAYHLGQLVEDGLLEKRGEQYALTRRGETYIPLLTHLTGKDLSPLPVVLVAACRGGDVLLLCREKRPYKGYWSLLGGKMLFGEGPAAAARRVLQEKAGLVPSSLVSRAVLFEQVKEEDVHKHSFILFFVEASVAEGKAMEKGHGELRWIPVGLVANEKIIPSDLWLLQHKMGSTLEVVEETLADEGDLRLSFP